MKTLLAAMLAVLAGALPAFAGQHAVTREICHARAAQASGYTGAYGAKPVQNTARSGISLSGSARLGIAYSSGGPLSNGTGRDGYERLEQQAKVHYSRLYDACMQGR